MVPARSICRTATRTRPSARGRRSAGRAGPAARVPTGRSGRSSWNHTVLWAGVYSTPQREASAAHSWRPRPPSRSRLPMVTAAPWRGTSRSGYRSATSIRTPSSPRRQSRSAEVPACTTALVTSSLVRTTASSTMSPKPQPWRVSRTKARALATERPTGSKVAAARAVITELLDRYSTGMTPWPTGSRRCCGSSPVGRGSGGCSPGISPVVIGAAALRCPLVCSPPPRPDGPGWLDSRMQGYLPSRSERMPVCCVSVRRGLPSGTCADDVRSCRTVMAWFGGGETLGRLVVKVRAGGVSFAPDGQQPFGGALPCRADIAVVQKCASVTGTPCGATGSTAATVYPCGRDTVESGAATRGTKTRAKGGQSPSGPGKKRSGTTVVDTAALNRLLVALVAMRDGNFRRRLTVSGDGVMSEIAAVFNEVADRNLHLAGERARVRRMVGREGKLTERLETGACEGSWSTAIDNSNALVDDLVRPVSEVSRVLPAVAEGDLSPRMELRTQAPDGTGHPLRGEFLKVARTVN